jgi:hypothetical protein
MRTESFLRLILRSSSTSTDILISQHCTPAASRPDIPLAYSPLVAALLHLVCALFQTDCISIFKSSCGRKPALEFGIARCKLVEVQICRPASMQDWSKRGEHVYDIRQSFVHRGRGVSVRPRVRTICAVQREIRKRITPTLWGLTCSILHFLLHGGALCDSCTNPVLMSHRIERHLALIHMHRRSARAGSCGRWLVQGGTVRGGQLPHDQLVVLGGDQTTTEAVIQEPDETWESREGAAGEWKTRRKSETEISVKGSVKRQGAQLAEPAPRPAELHAGLFRHHIGRLCGTDRRRRRLQSKSR